MTMAAGSIWEARATIPLNARASSCDALALVDIICSSNSHNARSFRPSLRCPATEIIPQGISIALSIRELIRQAYVYSAAILIRPLIERAGTIYYLQAHPDAVEAWRTGWPRRAQPSFEDLLAGMHPAAPADIQEAFRTMLHKLVHSDPAGSVYNMFERHDGVPVFSCGKMLDPTH
jgi:hypothetical protein